MDKNIIRFLTKSLFLMSFIICFSSCGDDNDEPDDPNNPNESNLEEILVNSYSGHNLYEDEQYEYRFGLSYDSKDIVIECKNKLGNGSFKESPQVNGKYLCAMKNYSDKKVTQDQFKALKTKYTDTSSAENLLKRYLPVNGTVFLSYITDYKGELIHHKIYVIDAGYNRKNGIPESFKYLKIYCVRY